MRARRAATQSSSSKPRKSQELDIFADPVESSSSKSGSRLRRNSDSSVLSGHRKPMDSEEERKRQERRRRERRERREKEGKDPKHRKPPKNLDIIDKLDVTSIYGTGCEFKKGKPRKLNTNIVQYSTTMAHSMLVTLTAIAKAADVHLCKLSLRIH